MGDRPGDDALTRAEKTVAAGDAGAALAALLEAWRSARAPAYADAIDALSKAAARPAKLDTHEAWMALAGENDAADVGPLVDALLTAKVSTLGGRVEHLVARPDDPRIAMAFARAALEPPFTASSNFGIWSKMYDAMIKAADTRIVPFLQKRLAEPEGDSKFWPRHYKAIEKVLKKLPAKAPDVSADAKKRLSAIAKAAKTSSPAAPAPKKKKAAPAGDPLERAAIAAESSEWRDCLAALLDAWRPIRIGALGTAIERVSAILEDGRPPPHGKKVQAAWLAMAEKNDLADIGLLAESSSDPKNSEAESNMDRMATWPEDPRVGRAMLSKAFAHTYSDRSRAWTLVGNLIVRNADTRFADAVARLATDRSENKARNGCIGRVAKELAPILAQNAHVLGPIDEKQLHRVNAAVDAYHASDAETDRSFIARIAADLDNDEPRLVYADWLTERGHPRGELIVLQCAQRAGTATPEQVKRITELTQESPRAFLGLAANLMYQSLDYAVRTDGIIERGFLTQLPLYYSPPAWTFAETPHLATVEAITFGARGRRAFMDVIRAGAKVREVRVLPLEALGELCQFPTPTAIEKLSLQYWQEVESPLANALPALDGVGLSNLKSLDLLWARSADDFVEDGAPEKMIAAPLMQNVERLTVATANIAPLLAMLKKHGRKARMISIARRGYALERIDIALGNDLAPTSIAIGRDDPRTTSLTSDNQKLLFDVLQNLSAPALSDIRVVDGLELSDAVKKRLETLAAKRFAAAKLHA